MHTQLTIGIDEAGRGPILGPMVLSCVALTEDAAAALRDLGVADSKSFGAGERAHARRLALASQVQRHATYAAISVVDVAEIDRRAGRGELNRLEQEQALALLQGAPLATHIYADGKRLFQPLCAHYPHLQAVDGGESVHVAVAAASILAKVRRDEMWLRIARRYAPLFGEAVHRGGGYLNDPTRRFLRAYCERFGALPPEGRRSWPWPFVQDLLNAPRSNATGQLDLGFADHQPPHAPLTGPDPQAMTASRPRQGGRDQD